MPVVNVRVPAGSLSQDQKQAIVSGITDVIIRVEGIEKVRPYTVVLIDEVADGGWGQGGRALTLEQLQHATAP
jgi:4-oxalocrotonate tautomerase